jgi:tRNA(fMet)-specific endonuclease VapC
VVTTPHLTHLLDTDVCIEALRRRNQAVARRFLDHDADLAVSSVTVSELMYGAERSSRRDHDHRAITEFLAMVTVLPLDEIDATQAAAIRAELARVGTPIGGYDVLIAGQARARSLIVATGNLAEFARVDGLRVENWSGQ